MGEVLAGNEGEFWRPVTGSLSLFWSIASPVHSCFICTFKPTNDVGTFVCFYCAVPSFPPGTLICSSVV